MHKEELRAKDGLNKSESIFQEATAAISFMLKVQKGNLKVAISMIHAALENTVTVTPI